ncbi:MAG: transposase [Cytophagaceae bacterium]|nr:transposase [Cytophagaceae bacterium]
MTFDKNKHQRRSIRWPTWDYAGQGSYFVTMCARNRACLFGEIRQDEMILSEIGTVIESTWLGLSSRFENLQLDTYQVMPNHVHAILRLEGDVRLGDVIGAFKSLASNTHYNQLKMSGMLPETEAKIWQRNYRERVIRNEQEAQKCRSYILANVTNWREDSDNLSRLLARMTEHKSS